MTSTSELTIERKTFVRAPRSRVWRALTNSKEFAAWFSCSFTGDFKPGARIDMVSTAESHKGVPFSVIVERIEPEHTFSWRWSPGAIQPGEDRSKEGETVVVFKLEEVEGGTAVTVTESGFDRVSLARRAQVIKENTAGWEYQMKALEKYVSQAA